MKTHAQIDAIYRAAATHSHDAAIDAVYEEGLKDARAAMKPAPVSAPPVPTRPLATNTRI
jgi:hypothetical protein